MSNRKPIKLPVRNVDIYLARRELESAREAVKVVTILRSLPKLINPALDNYEACLNELEKLRDLKP